MEIANVVNPVLNSILNVLPDGAIDLYGEVEWRYHNFDELSDDQRHRLMTLRDKKIISLEWLGDPILDAKGVICNPMLYKTITDDKTESGCLQFLNGEIVDCVRYIDILAWVGLKQMIKDGLTEFDFLIYSNLDKYCNQFKTSLGITVEIENNETKMYLKKILCSSVSKEQFQYVFGNTECFSSIPSKNLSKEPLGNYFLQEIRGNVFSRKTKVKEENYIGKSS